MKRRVFWAGCLLLLVLSFISTAYGAKVTTLKMYWWEDRFLDTMKSYINDFEDAHPGVKVDLQIIPFNTYYEKLPVMMAGGTGPDVFFLASGQVQNYAKMNVLLDLKKYLPANKLQNIRSAQVRFVTYQGKMTAVPFTATYLTIYANKDLFAKAGIEIPTTVEKAWNWEQFKKALEKVKEVNNLDYAMLNGNREFWWLPWFYANGAKLYTSDMKAAAFNSPAALEAFDYLAGLTKQRLIAPPKTSPNYELFYQGKVALLSAGHWERSVIDKFVNGKFSYTVTIFPKRKKNGLAVGGDYLAVYKKSKNAKLAAKFVDFLTSKTILADYAAKYEYLSPRTDIKPNYGQGAALMDTVMQQTELTSPELTIDRGIPQYGKISTVINAEYELVMLGQKNSKDALKTIETEITQALSNK